MTFEPDPELLETKKLFLDLANLANRHGLDLWIGRSHIVDDIVLCINAKPIHQKDLESENSQLLMLSIDQNDKSARILKHRTAELTATSKNRAVSHRWIEKFIKMHDCKNRPEENVCGQQKSFHAPRALSSEKVFYVYRHTFANGQSYIGKGKGDRVSEFYSGRSIHYERIIQEYGEPEVEILANGMAEDLAYSLENYLILCDRANKQPIINRTDGEELAYLEELPWRTLEVLKPKIVDPRYTRIIHIASQNGMLHKTSLGVTIVHAAIKIECTIREVLALLDQPKGTLLNNWKTITNEEAAAMYPQYADQIFSGKPM